MPITAVLLCTVPAVVARSVDGGVGEGGRGEAAASRRAEAARHGGGGREAGDRHPRPRPVDVARSVDGGVGEGGRGGQRT